MRYSAKLVKNVFKVINMKKLVGATMVDPPKRRRLISCNFRKQISRKKSLKSMDIN